MSVSALPEVDWPLAGWQKANYRRPDPQPKASGNRRHLGINPKFGLENESFRIRQSAIERAISHQP
jgi:hypothetical protein